MVTEKLRANPAVDSADVTPPSREVTDVIEHNREHIEAIARVSALQGMPLILSRGESTTLSQETKRLIATIEGLIRQAIDEGAGNAQDTCGIFSVEVFMAHMSGEEHTHRAKNKNVLDVDVTIPLENAVLDLPPKHYTKLAKRFAEWLDE